MQYKLFFATVLMHLMIVCHAQQVGIGTQNPHSSALLDVSSADKGVLVPRMTTAQRNAIASPATGLMVYDTDSKSFAYYNGTGWQLVTGAVATTKYYSLSGAVKFSLAGSNTNWEWIASNNASDAYVDLVIGQRIIASGVMCLGILTGSNATNVGVSWGYQRVDDNLNPNGLIIPFTGFSFPAVTIPGGSRQAVPCAATVNNLGTGKYRVGMIVRNASAGISLNNNDFFSGWVMLAQ